MDVDDTFVRSDLGHVLDTLVAMRWDLGKALNDGEDIPEMVKTRMMWADSELDLATTALKVYLGGRGLPPL